LPALYLPLGSTSYSFGSGGIRPGVAPELAYSPENDLGPAFVAFHFTIDLDFRALQAADVSDPFQISGENDHRERAHAIVLAEVEEMHTVVPLFHAQHFASDTFGGADVFLGVG